MRPRPSAAMLISVVYHRPAYQVGQIIFPRFVAAGAAWPTGNDHDSLVYQAEFRRADL